MRRVVIGGETCAGKTTFSRTLARRLDVPVIELDALFWGPKWTKPAPEEFRARVTERIAGDAWVVDGNYSVLRDLVWPRADTFVWLDPPLHVLLWRLVLRTNRRIRSREELWRGSGNRERFTNAYLSKDSLYLWLVRAYRRHQRAWPRALAQAQYAHLQVHRFRTSAAAQRWLEAIPAADARISRVSSARQRNVAVEDSGRRLVAEGLARSGVETARDRVELRLAVT